MTNKHQHIVVEEIYQHVKQLLTVQYLNTT
jgi:hypothetical protein